jgi:hypothetical protein
MTCFAAIVEPGGRVLYTGAGHVAPYLVHPAGRAGERIAIDALVARGNPLGVKRSTSSASPPARCSSSTATA